jgi:hypothetical protein
MPVTIKGPYYLEDDDAQALPFEPPAKTKRQRRQVLQYWLANDLADADVVILKRIDDPDFKGYEYFER